MHDTHIMAMLCILMTMICTYNNEQRAVHHHARLQYVYIVEDGTVSIVMTIMITLLKMPSKYHMCLLRSMSDMLTAECTCSPGGLQFEGNPLVGVTFVDIKCNDGSICGCGAQFDKTENTGVHALTHYDLQVHVHHLWLGQRTPMAMLLEWK